MAATTGEALACKVRLADGRLFDDAIPPERHRSLHLGMLHLQTAGYVEIAAGPRPAGGKVRLNKRTDPNGYLPGGANGDPNWLTNLLALADRHARDGLEVFVGVAPRTQRRGNKELVAESRFLWVDVDRPDRLDELWGLLRLRPAHLVVESGGSGGVHAYWRLAEPLPARAQADSETDVEWIERAHMRLIHYLGVDADGKPNVADSACKDRSRVMRLAGTVNYKTGRHARLVFADFQRPGYTFASLVGDMPDPDQAAKHVAARREAYVDAGDDPYRGIPAADYYRALTGREAGRGLVTCPTQWHRDTHPSCSLGTGAKANLWNCHGCGAGGGIYDMASVIEGGPYGRGRLIAEDFKRAHQRVVEVFGDRRPQRRRRQRRHDREREQTEAERHLGIGTPPPDIEQEMNAV